MDIRIEALTPELAQAYLDFFDRRAFSDGSPNYPCYCCAFNLSADAIARLRQRADAIGAGTEGWKSVLRERAAGMVRAGKIRGFLAFDGDAAVGWCNANDRLEFFRVGGFDTDSVPPDGPPPMGLKRGQVKSVVCFEIAPGYRGKGIASRLLERACADARDEGYEAVEAYPADGEQEDFRAFAGPVRLYEKAGFTRCSRAGSALVMRKKLR